MALLPGRHVIVAAVLVVGLFVSAEGVAANLNSYTTATVNLRVGPGAGYAALATVPVGVNVHLETCSDGWCHVGWHGFQGWVAAKYLRGEARASPGIGASQHIIYQILDFRP